MELIGKQSSAAGNFPESLRIERLSDVTDQRVLPLRGAFQKGKRVSVLQVSSTAKVPVRKSGFELAAEKGVLIFVARPFTHVKVLGLRSVTAEAINEWLQVVSL